MTANIPNHLLYTREHEWIEKNDDVVTIGITEHAQESLGDLVYVELPEIGQDVEAGDHFAVVESVKAASEVYSPVTGEVIEVNSELEEEPEIINEAPYDDGWIVKIRLEDADELEDLMDSDSYEAFITGLNS